MASWVREGIAHRSPVIAEDTLDPVDVGGWPVG